MTSFLQKKIVLVLNKNWQAINTATPVEIFGQMANGTTTGLDVQGNDWMLPVEWKDWVQLPILSLIHI